MSSPSCSKKSANPYAIFAAACLMLLGCIEPFEPSTPFYEEIMVIEATLTDEIKNQEILLSKSFQFEEFVPLPEEGATIRVVDDSLQEYTFQEVTPGRYVSNATFGAQPGVSYQLFITAADGRKFTSDPATTPTAEPIFDIKANRMVNDAAIEGTSINVVYAPRTETKYYRYEYEEMYKIIAPNFVDVFLLFIGPCEAVQWPKGQEGKVCYDTDVSNTIIFNSPKGNEVGESLEFPVRFINSDNYILSHRYGIRIKQYAITKEAYTYLETLKEFSGQDNIFSQTQPGFFSGNVYSEDNTDEKVLGYFDVTSVSTKSLFFDYGDLYAGEPLPPYVNQCDIVFYDTCNVRTVLRGGDVLYYSSNVFFKHSVVKRVCGDCRVLGKSEIPEFWEE